MSVGPIVLIREGQNSTREWYRDRILTYAGRYAERLPLANGLALLIYFPEDRKGTRFA